MSKSCGYNGKFVFAILIFIIYYCVMVGMRLPAAS